LLALSIIPRWLAVAVTPIILGVAKSDVLHAFASDDGIPRTHVAVTAYFDLLGFTEEMRAAQRFGKSNEFLQRVAATLKSWYEAARDTSSDLWGNDRRLWELKAFTDNVVIGHPIRHGGEPELGHLMSDLAMLQLAFILEGDLFLRGGIAAGELYMDDDIVYGTALLDAVATEHNADAPRVLMHPSAVRLVREQLRHYASIRNAPHTRIVLRDEDGRFFINYLSAALEYASGSLEEWLEKHREVVVRRLERHRKSPRVWSKYAWVARYHNYFCGSLVGIKDLTIDVTLLSLGAARLDQVFRNTRAGSRKSKKAKS